MCMKGLILGRFSYSACTFLVVREKVPGRSDLDEANVEPVARQNITPQKAEEVIHNEPVELTKQHCDGASHGDHADNEDSAVLGLGRGSSKKAGLISELLEPGWIANNSS